MAIVFYYTPMSSATRVHWALEELGLPYEKVKVDLSAGEQRKPEFLAVNPNGKVPAMVIDGQPVFESLAMLLYLGEIWGVDKGLFPPPGPERLEAFKWMAWGAVSLGESVFKLLQNTSERWPAELRNAAAAEAARGELSKLMRVLDDQLRGREYVLGAFTLADCAVATMAALLGRIGFDLSPYPQVGAWIGRCLTRPAMARVLAG